ncbi:MAG TPA: tetratricopeptide repeat protein [Beijerinckiaceae bacterium]|jgi:tetratricopeptide (TPR) repeat protein
MRFFVLAASLAAGLIPPASAASEANAPVLVQQGAPAKPQDGARPGADRPDPKPAPRPDPRQASLDDLFRRLAETKDATEANGIATLIERRWSRSGSDTADLLLSRAGEALQAKDYPLGIELLDRVLVLKPDWAEAWNRRATAFYLLDDPVSAMADVRQVVTREPRHFAAWAGLGHMYLAAGDKARAVLAYRKALAIHPHLPRVKEAVDRLAPEIDGRDL